MTFKNVITHAWSKEPMWRILEKQNKDRYHLSTEQLGFPIENLEFHIPFIQIGNSAALAGVAQMVEQSHVPRSHQLDSWSGNMPGVSDFIPSRERAGGRRLMFLSSVFLPLSPLPLKSINRKKHFKKSVIRGGTGAGWERLMGGKRGPM